jgi:hypothetical protein
MRYAIIEHGVVVNIALADEALAPNWIQSDNAVIGDLYVDGLFTKPLPDTSAAAAAIRAERDSLLTASDWTQVIDAPVDQAAWATYRQALRDIPQQAGFPWTITWPVKP